ncbi:MAG: hypothetical protein KAX51_14905 [Chromatiaceae bacterium]|nr:hypothetical protein [Chromatiaceae bacterium]MBP8285127.1 hypothetical protein [Chromatiaceae bacterium]MBP8291067.1 hypothetical protein [Chromatiaceae bacterium]
MADGCPAPTFTRAAYDAMDRMDQIASVWQAIADLTYSRDDLHCVGRDNLGSALGFLCREYDAAREAFSSACQEGPSARPARAPA